MTTRLTILCENSVGKPGRAIGEHGFACLVETPEASFLFDTGQGLGLAANVAELGCDLTGIDGIVLSHGHYDHGDGLPAALTLTGPTVVYAHPEIFTQRYWRSPYELRSIGLSHTQSACEQLGARFDFAADFRQLAPHVWLSGEVPRNTPFETGDPHLVIENSSGYLPDPLRDDQSLIIRSPEGLILLLGCAHAGLINIVEHTLRQSGEERIYAVVGGTHLGPASDEQYHATVKRLRNYGVQRMAIGHCTGLGRAAQLASNMDCRCSFAAVGTVLEF